MIGPKFKRDKSSSKTKPSQSHYTAYRSSLWWAYWQTSFSVWDHGNEFVWSD